MSRQVKPPHSWEEELFLVDTSPYKASWWAQFRAVLWRSSLSVFKEPQLIKVRMLQTVVRIHPTECGKMFNFVLARIITHS